MFGYLEVNQKIYRYEFSKPKTPAGVSGVTGTVNYICTGTQSLHSTYILVQKERP
jgi:hypothetical protein